MSNIISAITEPEKKLVSGLYGLVIGDDKEDGDDKASSSNSDKTFHELFPKRQVFVPSRPYPLWDSNWAGGMQIVNGSNTRAVRHILLIRHGQYEENHNHADKKVLTDLGQRQAKKCGQRLREMIVHNNKNTNPNHKCKLNVMITSTMTRAKQTGEVIADELKAFDLPLKDGGHDSLLDEGHPAHPIPSSEYTKHDIKRVDEDHPRIEKAFQKYFANSLWHEKECTKERLEKVVDKVIPSSSESSSTKDHPGQPFEDKHHNGEERMAKAHHHHKDEETEHEFQVMVTHSNVIRYFACRALQLPPEAWLRFNLFNTSITYLVIHSWGSVSCRMIGDCGHLSYDEMSISEHTGFQWE